MLEGWHHWTLDLDEGWVDLGEFMENPYGFFPMVMPVTDQNFGYGAAVLPVFVKTPAKGQGAHPDMWAAGGMATTNGPEAVLGGFSEYFEKNRWHVFGGITWPGGHLFQTTETVLTGGEVSVISSRSGMGCTLEWMSRAAAMVPPSTSSSAAVGSAHEVSNP